MKRVFKLIALILTICMVFVGCTDENGQKPDNDPAGNGGKQDPESDDPGTLKVYCFELGKADAFLIYNNKSTIIIDTGERGQGKDILQYMENNDIKGIDMMFITHFDKDHVGGAAKLIGNTEVGEIYTPSYVKPSDDYDNFTDKVKEKNKKGFSLQELI